MKFAVAVVAAAFATLASAQAFCAEASRFGNIKVTPETVIPGHKFTITNDLTCPPVYDIHPRFIDYFIEIPADQDNGFQPRVYLGRSTLNVSHTPKTDVFVGRIPTNTNVTGYGYGTIVIYPIDPKDPQSALFEGGTLP